MPKTKCSNCGKTAVVNDTGICQSCALLEPEPQADLHPQTQMEPTPRPWHTDGVYIWRSELAEERIVAKVQTSEVCESIETCWANAELIVRAVNSFDDLLEACKRLLKHAGIADADPEDIDGEDHRAESFARSAIKKAENLK